ncbi:hypothetical protein N2152v2_002348 [Parachlorella kessleri]
MATTTAVERLNRRVAESALGRYFKISQRGTTFTKELQAGVATFLTVAYILAVNANIIAATGGTCVEPGGACPNGPASVGVPACEECLASFKQSLVVSTAATCLIAHVLIGTAANLPLALVPGMGLNAYFTYTVVGYMGTGMVSYREALAAVFVEGLIFAALGALGLRSKFIELIPRSVMMSTSAGIGLYLAFIGLQSANGLGVVTYDPATLVTLGGCTSEYQSLMYEIPTSAITTNSLCEVVNGTGVVNTALLNGPSSVHACDTAGRMRAATMWLGIAGGMLMAIMMALGMKGSTLVGILFVTIISWIPACGNKAAWLGACSDTPGGEARLDNFKQVAEAPNASASAGKIDFGGLGNGQLWVALVTFLYVDFLDATGTLQAMANFMGNYIPDFVDPETKQFQGQLAAFTVDGFAISIGALLGVSPVTVAVESANGIREGARTGIASLMGAALFFVALFFNPILSSIPPYATGPALILVGALMLAHVTHINWSSVQEAVPAFLTLCVMPLTYSIAYGVIAGICSYIILNGAVFLASAAKIKLGWAPAPPPGISLWQLAKQMTFASFDGPDNHRDSLAGAAAVQMSEAVAGPVHEGKDIAEDCSKDSSAKSTGLTV